MKRCAGLLALSIFTASASAADDPLVGSRRHAIALNGTLKFSGRCEADGDHRRF